jgi:hypothetical protein
MIRAFMGGAEPGMRYAKSELAKAFGEKFGAYAAEAVRTMEEWDLKSCTGDANKTLCTWDLRTDNMVWRKTPGGPSEYECIIIDHQVWNYVRPRARPCADVDSMHAHGHAESVHRG